MTDIKCPICLTNAKLVPPEGYGRIKDYKCPVCGPYSITNEVTLINNPVDYRLSAWIREHQEFKREPPKITTHILDDVLKNLPDYKVSEKQILLLRAIERRTEYPGAEVQMNKEDYPLAWAKNDKELKFLLLTLADRRLTFIDQDFLRADIMKTKILPDGWDYLDKLSSLPAFTNQAFVAMSFDKELDLIWKNGIKPAVEKAGYKPHRVDKDPHIDRIDAKIIADIKDSQFVIADVTQQKQGVYFEAGFALGLKLPVIWCIREDDLKNVHFDTRQYNHIVWKTPEDLQERLYEVICAVIGKGTQKQ
jgi:nucleoside 2-deoxyribosyltransferase